MSQPDAIPTYDVLGTPVSIVTPHSALARLVEWSRDGQGRYVCIRDVHGVMRAREDAELARIHRQADMVTPDGMPIAIIGKLRGLPVARTSGPDLMFELMRASPKRGLKHYFYGGAEGVAEDLAEKLVARFPGLSVVGADTPPFRPISEEDLAGMAERIAASGAHFVWIGLSTPKQEKLMARLAPLVGATLVGVGAAFDIHSGRIARAPVWMRKLSLEGVYRLLVEPRAAVAALSGDGAQICCPGRTPAIAAGGQRRGVTGAVLAKAGQGLFELHDHCIDGKALPLRGFDRFDLS